MENSSDLNLGVGMTSKKTRFGQPSLEHNLPTDTSWDTAAICARTVPAHRKVVPPDLCHGTFLPDTQWLLQPLQWEESVLMNSTS